MKVLDEIIDVFNKERFSPNEKTSNFFLNTDKTNMISVHQFSSFYVMYERRSLLGEYRFNGTSKSYYNKEVKNFIKFNNKHHDHIHVNDFYLYINDELTIIPSSECNNPDGMFNFSLMYSTEVLDRINTLNYIHKSVSDIDLMIVLYNNIDELKHP